jgi:hypothetical protein
MSRRYFQEKRQLRILSVRVIRSLKSEIKGTEIMMQSQDQKIEKAKILLSVQPCANCPKAIEYHTILHNIAEPIKFKK